jgi:hypothetical protein
MKRISSIPDPSDIPVDVFEKLLRQRVGWMDEAVSPFARKPVREEAGPEAEPKDAA